MASELPADPPTVTRIAGKADPPTIVVGFTTAGSRGRERRYVIRLRTGVEKLGSATVFDALLKKYPRFFGSPSRSEALRRILARLLSPASHRPATGRGAQTAGPVAGARDGGASTSSREAPAAAAAATASTTTTTTTTTTTSSSTTSTATVSKDVLLRESERLGDLQTAADSVVVQAKGVMDKGYEAHRLRPGDEGYEYDRQVDFGEPEESNDWDD